MNPELNFDDVEQLRAIPAFAAYLASAYRRAWFESLRADLLEERLAEVTHADVWNFFSK